MTPSSQDARVSLPTSVSPPAQRWLTSPLAEWLFAGVALLLALPSLGHAFVTDDLALRVAVQRGNPPFSLFEFDHQLVAEALEFGGLSWWSYPAFHGSFLRPLSSLTHYVDFRLWPDAAWWMHLESIAIYVASVWVAARLYQLLMPDHALSAGLAGLLFAIDDGHAPALGWIASRNTLLATLLTLLTVAAHVRARRDDSSRLHALSALYTGLALSAGELGVSALAYLTAYALIFEPGASLSRLRSVLPQLAVFGVWAALYVLGGYGMHGAAIYREWSQPVALVGQGVLDLPLWLTSLLGPSVIAISGILPFAAPRLIALLVALPLVAAVWPGRSGDPALRFFALSAVLCLLPLFTTMPQDRVLPLASFAAFGLIAHCIGSVTRASGAGLRAARVAFIAFHLVMSPLNFIPSLAAHRPIALAASELAEQVAQRPSQSTVLLNSPFEILPLYAAIALTIQQRAPAPPLRALYAGASALEAQRIDERTLELHAPSGWGALVIERVFTPRERMPGLGEKRRFGELDAQVVALTQSGLPATVRFQFPSALEDPARTWLVWKGTRPVRWKPPPIGERVSFQPLNMLSALPR